MFWQWDEISTFRSAKLGALFRDRLVWMYGMPSRGPDTCYNTLPAIIFEDACGWNLPRNCWCFGVWPWTVRMAFGCLMFTHPSGTHTRWVSQLLYITPDLLRRQDSSSVLPCSRAVLIETILVVWQIRSTFNMAILTCSLAVETHVQRRPQHTPTCNEKKKGAWSIHPPSLCSTRSLESLWNMSRWQLTVMFIFALTATHVNRRCVGVDCASESVCHRSLQRFHAPHWKTSTRIRKKPVFKNNITHEAHMASTAVTTWVAAI